MVQGVEGVFWAAVRSPLTTSCETGPSHHVLTMQLSADQQRRLLWAELEWRATSGPGHRLDQRVLCCAGRGCAAVEPDAGHHGGQPPLW